MNQSNSLFIYFILGRRLRFSANSSLLRFPFPYQNPPFYSVYTNLMMNHRHFVDGNDFSQKPAIDLLRNCDLPPPLKVFSQVGLPATRVFGYGGEDEKLELLRALRLSQTRAREAERRAATLAKERDALADALVRDSMRLMAHRHWVRLLEAQVNKLKLKAKGRLKEEDDGKGSVGMFWMMGFAICLGVVGVGLAFS